MKELKHGSKILYNDIVLGTVSTVRGYVTENYENPETVINGKAISGQNINPWATRIISAGGENVPVIHIREGEIVRIEGEPHVVKYILTGNFFDFLHFVKAVKAPEKEPATIDEIVSKIPMKPLENEIKKRTGLDVNVALAADDNNFIKPKDIPLSPHVVGCLESIFESVFICSPHYIRYTTTGKILLKVYFWLKTKKGAVHKIKIMDAQYDVKIGTWSFF